MNGYVYSVVCVAAACGIVCIVSPEGVRSGIKKHLKLVCSLCLLSVLISPIAELMDGMSHIIDGGGESIFGEVDKTELRESYESIYDKYIDGGYGDNVGQAAKEMLYEKFGIPEEECRIQVEFADKNGDGVREPFRMVVILSGRSMFREPESIRSFLTESFDCQCECAIE